MQSVTFNNVSYTKIPDSGNVGWSQLTDFLVALANFAQTTSAQKRGVRVATTSPVTVAAATDATVVVKLASPGAVTVNLPAGVSGQVFTIVDGTGDAATNNITVTPNGAETINGAASFVIDTNRGAVTLQYNTTTKWNVLDGETPSLSVADDNFVLFDEGDPSKKLKLQLSGITTATTRTLTVPDASTTIVGTDTAQTLTNKTITVADNVFTIVDNGDATKELKFQLSGLSTATTRTITIPDASGTLAYTTTAQNMSNKTFTNSTFDSTCAVTLYDTALTLQDDGDDTKQAQFDLSNLSTASTRTYGLPDVSGTLIVADAEQIDNNDIYSAAAIARTKIANGTANHVLINDGSGTMSSEASLAVSRGGTGQTSANAALNALLPSQSGNANKVLKTDGTDASWTSVAVTVTANRGEMIRRGASADEAFQAKTDNRVVRGDGTDVILGQIDDPDFFTTGAAAGASAIGIVTTSSQSFGGTKTFSAGVVVPKDQGANPSSIGEVYSGTWTPSLSNKSNISSETALAGNYIRVGDVVMCSMRMTVTTAASSCTATFSLPVTPAFSGSAGLNGTVIANNTVISSVEVYAGTGGNNALGTFSFIASSAVATALNFTFAYNI